MSLNGSTSTYSGNETYGALIIPYVPKKFAPLNDVKEQQNFKGKLTSALKNAGNNIKNAITNPVQIIKDTAKYLKDNSSDDSNAYIKRDGKAVFAGDKEAYNFKKA